MRRLSHFQVMSLFAVFAVLIVAVQSPASAQFPSTPDKNQPLAAPPAPAKATPQAGTFATPQQTYVPQQDLGVDYVPVARAILRVPSSYVVQRQIVVRDVAPVYDVASYDVSPVVCDTGVSLALAGQGCGVVQQQVVQRQIIQRNVVSHGIQHQAVVNHALGAGVGRGPRKIVTKQVTKQKGRGVFGLFGG